MSEQRIEHYNFGESIMDNHLNLFPEEKYLYIGSKFNNLLDGFGMQKFESYTAFYFGVFRNNYRINVGHFMNTKENYEYK